MGSSSSRVHFDKWQIMELSRLTDLSPQKIEEARQDFLSADGQLTMGEFVRVYMHFPGAQFQDSRYIQNQISRIFHAFDRDHSGKLSLEGYLGAIVMMNYSVPRHDRFNFLIRQWNPYSNEEGNDKITSKYGHQVFQTLNDYYGVPVGTDDEEWKQLDRNNRGYVTHDEFMDFINKQEAYNSPYQS